jgi:AcrR family transcriptional regulator
VADNEVSPHRRLSRAEAKAQTRERLLAAAARVFARKGYAGASVEEIAESAGYSTGALYSNFGSKEEVFLELLAARRSRSIARQAAAVADALREGAGDGPDPLTALSRRLEHIDGTGTDAGALQAEFWLYAVRNPRAMQVLAGTTDERVEALTPVITAVLEHYGAEAPAAPEAVTRVVLALYQGLARQRRIDPGAVPADLLTQALQWLLAGLRTGAQQPLPGAPQPLPVRPEPPHHRPEPPSGGPESPPDTPAGPGGPAALPGVESGRPA